MTANFATTGGAEVLFDRGLVEWNERTWGLRAQQVEYLPEGRSSARLRAILYQDARGRTRQPRLDPYLALSFESSAAPGSPQRERQWLSTASQLASDLKRSQLQGAANLPPGFVDARPLTWGGLLTTVRFTYVGALPHDASKTESAVRKRISKATRAGYSFEAHAASDVLRQLLESTGARQGFSYGLKAGNLELLDELVAPEVFRRHAVRDSTGEVVSAGARLVAENGVALDWIQGTEPAALNNGAVQLMYAGVLQDLDRAGAALFDFGGANIPAVARAKASWGLPLAPYIAVSRPSLKQLALQIPAVRALAMRART